ncbi:MAG: formate dehydrogenase subunit alpha, partial [Rhodospirillales bacterium]|nr:formate dehydrogenase subunit alpha [Rhodospirillales bacterium]
MTAIRFSLDGEDVEAAPGETIWTAAHRAGVEIPYLCHLPSPGYRPDGNCRACLVEVEGERVLAASCRRTVAPGMVVLSASARARHARRMVFELLLADMPAGAARDRTGVFAQWADRLGVTSSRFAPEPKRPAPDLSHPAMAVQLDACIACGLCERACREVQHNDVIGFARRGMATAVSFDLGDPMGASSCVACGECVQACPTGALLPKTVLDAEGRRAAPPAAEVASVCPYCGVGCQVGFRVRDNRIEEVVGRDGPANAGRLCVKGRFGFDYLAHPDRLTRPLIRLEGAAKDPDDCLDPARARDRFREASWEEAMERAAQGLISIRDGAGPSALAGFGSAKGSNEEAYLFQKLVRAGFGTNNVDHCTRLCH